jgi:hypothetical protein
MNRVTNFLLAVLVAMLGAGCRSGFDGYIVFDKTSDTDLKWVTVSGFPRNPPCGVLMARTHAGSFVGSMQLPATATATWRYNGQADQQTVLTLLAEALSARKGDLRFEFGKDKKWTLSHKRDTA